MTQADAARGIRQHMAALGYDLGDATDEEIQAGVLRFGDAIQAAKLTTQEVVGALMAIAKAGETSADTDAV